MTTEVAAFHAATEHRTASRRGTLSAAVGGVAGIGMLGLSFSILPRPPAVTAALGVLVDYANHHHDLLLWTAWLEAAGNALFVIFLVVVANADTNARRTSRLLTLLCGGAVLAVGLLYAVCLIAMAESARLGGAQLATTGVAYGLWAGCEHAFLVAPPVFLPLGFAIRGSSLLGSRFSGTAIALGCTAIVLGLVGLFYAGPNNSGATGTAINVLVGVQAIWAVAAAWALHSRLRQTHPDSGHGTAEVVG